MLEIDFMSTLSLFKGRSCFREIFSSFMIYAGLHGIRRDYYFYRQFLERKVLHINPSAYFYNAKTNVNTVFNKATIEPKINSTGHPDFYIKVSNDDGDELILFAKSHNHAQFLLDRRIIKKLWQTMFNYNEYMYQVTKIKGCIKGDKFEIKNHGKLWGNIEYTWGISL